MTKAHYLNIAEHEIKSLNHAQLGELIDIVNEEIDNTQRRIALLKQGGSLLQLADQQERLTQLQTRLLASRRKFRNMPVFRASQLPLA